MHCPICKRETPYEQNPFRPFCSEHCKLVDLDNWLEGRYRIPETTGEKQKPREPTAAENGKDGNGH